MPSNRFYLQCTRDTVGSNVAFHGKEGGYVTDLDKARVYTREEAQRAWNSGREIDQPLCADRVEKHAVWHVDCQLIPHESTTREKDGEYVVFKRQAWDGNDVYWIQKDGEPTTDFTKAAVFSGQDLGISGVWVPFDLANKVKRRTVSQHVINHRKMVQAAGLVTPEHVKRYRRRKGSSGKVRMNCPSCGRIAWQYNPYDFNGCHNINCEEWSLYAGD